MEKRRSEPTLYLGRTTFRNEGRRFGILLPDRRSHMAVLGMTGTGKTSLMQNMILQDLEAGEGIAVFDPHGDLVEAIIARIPSRRRADVVYLDTPNDDRRWCFNPLSGIAQDQRALAAVSLVEIFKKLWPDDWGPRLEHLLRNTIWTLLENPGTTLGDIPALLSDREYRKGLLHNVRNEAVGAFWREEFDRYSPGFRAVVIAPLLNKVGAFLTDPRVRRIVSDGESSFDLRHVMNNRGVLLVNLAKGRIGEGPASLLGSLLVSAISLLALARVDTVPARRQDFFAYLDEFQVFATLTLVNMLAELRKFRCALVLANQYLGQLAPELRSALLANVGTLGIFRVTADDARTLLADRGEKLRPEDLVRLPNREFAVRLLVRGEPQRMFSAVTEDTG